MSVTYSVFLLGMLTLCSLGQTQTVLELLKIEALSMETNPQCADWSCDCVFNEERGCCCSANEMFDLEDRVYQRIMVIQDNIYKLKMKVQALTTERKTAFQARMTSPPSSGGLNCLGPSTDPLSLAFADVTLNDGNGYNKALGTFTATTDGVYVFSFTITSDNDVTNKLKHKVVLKAEGNPLVAVWEENAEDFQDSATQYTIVSLKKGNQVYLELQKGRRICTSFTSNMFSGFLLYPL